MRLKSVLLPEPFGPMMPRTSPSRTARSILETAVNPPNRLVRFFTSSSIGCFRNGLAGADRLEAAAHEEVVDDAADAARHEHDDEHDDGAEHQHAIGVVVAREVVDQRHD